MVERAGIESTETQKSPFPKGLKVDLGKETSALVRAWEQWQKAKAAAFKTCNAYPDEKLEEKVTIKDGKAKGNFSKGI